MRADTATARRSRRSSRSTTSGSATSALLSATTSGTAWAPTSAMTSRTAVSWPSGSGWETSTTWMTRSASATSSSVDRNASTSWWGSRRTKPTVSVRVTARPSGSSARRTVGSRVANSASSTRTPAPVIRLSRLDLPALVYPAMAIDGTALRRRLSRLVSREVLISPISRRSLAIRVRIRRRSSSILVSPGPREPIPAPPATRPPAWRDIDSPQPRRRGSRYSSWASSTCALPSRDLACWAKMSRIRAVRSTTLTLTTSSRLRRWDGLSSPSTTTVSAPVSATMSPSSAALPEPRNVAASGLSRGWMRASSTWDPAVSASAASSAIDTSASCGSREVDRPASTTRSRRSCRYSTSVTSCELGRQAGDPSQGLAVGEVLLVAVEARGQRRARRGRRCRGSSRVLSSSSQDRTPSPDPPKG